ncbi:MAG: Ser-Thr-rich GPI-anchored membrane family protein, partial [Nanoarchaeota archaeon]
MKKLIFILFFVVAMAVLEMNAIEPASILVTAPTSGETWAQGETHQISWHAPYSTSPITIDLHRKTGGCSPCQTGANTFVRSLAVDIPNTGSYQWTIPRDIIADDYFVYIYEKNNLPGGDASDISFRVTGSSRIFLISPNSGETWAQGETHQVSWHAPYA